MQPENFLENFQENFKKPLDKIKIVWYNIIVVRNRLQYHNMKGIVYFMEKALEKYFELANSKNYLVVTADGEGNAVAFHLNENTFRYLCGMCVIKEKSSPAAKAKGAKDSHFRCKNGLLAFRQCIQYAMPRKQNEFFNKTGVYAPTDLFCEEFVDLGTLDSYLTGYKKFQTEYKGNMGNYAEYMICQAKGIEWEAFQSRSYKTGADLTIDGVDYEVKDMIGAGFQIAPNINQYI